MMRTWKHGTEEIMPRVIRYEQDAQIKRKGNTDYLKTDARSKDGWWAIRSFNTASGEWRLTALGKKYFSDHDGLPEFVIRIPATFDVYRPGRPNTQYEGWFPFELLELEMRQRLEALTVGPVPNRDARIAGFKAKNSRYAGIPAG